MIRLVVPVLFACAAAQAQNPAELLTKAPPEIDEALRSRVNAFYQAHVDAQFRKAYDMVDEESKDIFFAAEKRKYDKFRLVKIDFSDNFTRAKVLTEAYGTFQAPQFTFASWIPLLTQWRLVEGRWFLHLEPITERITPFGVMGTDPSKPSGPPGEGAGPPATLPSAEAILSLVKVDRTAIRLKSYEPAKEEVIISNGMPGTVQLEIQLTAFPGLTAKLDRTELKKGETAHLVFECNPADRTPKPTVTAVLRIQPLNKVVPIQLTFALPPEVEAKLPK